MSEPAITTTLLAAKQAKGLSFADLETLLGRWELRLCFTAKPVPRPTKPKRWSMPWVWGLGFGSCCRRCFDGVPRERTRSGVPTDPPNSRFYEIVQVYGMPMKEPIREKFGDGIMSAIDFTLDVEKVEDPKGDRVRVVMNGNFLSYQKR